MTIHEKVAAGVRSDDSHLSTEPVPTYHTVGIGAGPSNLSLAALFRVAAARAGLPGTEPAGQMALFDKQHGPSWHPALLYRGVRMQTGWLKDLVSLVDPTHELSFLNYLVRTGRLYGLLNAQFDTIPRIEYDRYLAWAAGQLPSIHYGVTVDRISYTRHGFEVRSAERLLARSQHLVVAVGTRAFTPAGLAGLPPERSFIADDLGRRVAGLTDQRDRPIAVVGGGQTGVECVFRLLGAGFTDIRWFGRQLWFQSIDDSPVANELFRPTHTDFLQGLSRQTRRRLIAESKLTGDALSPGALRVLYQANYDTMLELGRFPVTLLPGRYITNGEVRGDEVVLTAVTPEKHEEHRVGTVVVATGRESVPVPWDDDLRDRIDMDDNDEMIVELDFQVRWKGMNGHKIYAFNHSRYSHGLTNSGLTQLPVRAATVLNSLFGRELYPVRDDLCPVQWG